MSTQENKIRPVRQVFQLPTLSHFQTFHYGVINCLQHTALGRLVQTACHFQLINFMAMTSVINVIYNELLQFIPYCFCLHLDIQETATSFNLQQTTCRTN
jgi:hypothetical protein